MSSIPPVGDLDWRSLEVEVMPEVVSESSVEKIFHSPENSFNIEKWLKSNIGILSSYNGVRFFEFLRHTELMNFTCLNRNIRVLLSKEKNILISRLLSSPFKRGLFHLNNNVLPGFYYNDPLYTFLLTQRPLITSYSLNGHNFFYCNQKGISEIVPVFLCKMSELVKLLKNHSSSSFIKGQISTFFIIEDRFSKIQSNHLRILNAFERFEKLRQIKIPNQYKNQYCKSLNKLKKNLYKLKNNKWKPLEKGCIEVLDRLESFAIEKCIEVRDYYRNYSEDASLSILFNKELTNIEEENIFLARFFRNKLGLIHIQNPTNNVLTFNVISQKILSAMLSENLKNLKIRGYSNRRQPGRIMKIKIPKLDLEKESKEEESENSNEIQKYLHSVNYPLIPINHPNKISIQNLLSNQEEITEQTFIVCLELLKNNYRNLAIDLTFCINHLFLDELVSNTRGGPRGNAIEVFDPSTIQVVDSPNVIIPFVSSELQRTCGIMWIDTIEKKLEFLYISNGCSRNYSYYCIVNFLNIFYKAYFPMKLEALTREQIYMKTIKAVHIDKKDPLMYAYDFCQSRLAGVSFENSMKNLPLLMEIQGFRHQLARKLIES